MLRFDKIRTVVLWKGSAMTLDSEKLDIAKRFHAALASADWAGIRSLLIDDAT